MNQTGSSDNKYQYAGEQFDSATGDYYLRQRFYDTSSGRFGRMDTYEGRKRDPLTLHKYNYTHNNPINGIDPTGLLEFSLIELTATQTLGAALAGIALIGMGIKANRDRDAYHPEPLGGFGEDSKPMTILESILAWKDSWTPGSLGGFGEGAQPIIPSHTGHLQADLVDFGNFFFESTFRGPAARSFDWTHIIDRHSTWGKTSQLSGKKDVFYGLTEPQIKRSVLGAWKNREKLQTQDDLVSQQRRILYQGLDMETGYTIEMWYNQNTKEVETAYPVDKI